MKYLTQLIEVAQRNNYLVLDTETTGLDADAQIVQIAAVDYTGRVLINSLVKPTCPIPSRVTLIHGISDEDVADAPSWEEIWQELAKITSSRDLVMYNASFDMRMLEQTFSECVDADCWEAFRADLGDVACAMRAYTDHMLQLKPGRRGARWQSLSNACIQQGITLKHAHTAIDDCLMTLELVKKMIPA